MLHRFVETLRKLDLIIFIFCNFETTKFDRFRTSFTVSVWPTAVSNKNGSKILAVALQPNSAFSEFLHYFMHPLTQLVDDLISRKPTVFRTEINMRDTTFFTQKLKISYFSIAWMFITIPDSLAFGFTEILLAALYFLGMLPTSTPLCYGF